MYFQIPYLRNQHTCRPDFDNLVRKLKASSVYELTFNELVTNLEAHFRMTFNLNLPNGGLTTMVFNRLQVGQNSLTELFEIQARVFGLAIFKTDRMRISEGVTNRLITPTYVTNSLLKSEKLKLSL